MSPYYCVLQETKRRRRAEDDDDDDDDEIDEEVESESAEEEDEKDDDDYEDDADAKPQVHRRTLGELPAKRKGQYTSSSLYQTSGFIKERVVLAMH